MSSVEPLAADHAQVPEAVVLFAFIEAGRTIARPSPERVNTDPRPIVHRAGSIAAMVGMVPLADYCGAEAERNLSDVEWLAPRAWRHAAILREAMLESAVFPAPFGTLYASLGSLTAFMAAHEATIARFLQDAAGKEEWGLKATADLGGQDVLETHAARTWPDWPLLTPGVRYMRLCRDRPALLDLARAKARDAVADLIADLESPAIAVRQLGPTRGADDGQDDCIARYALLVPAAGAVELHEWVDAMGAMLAREGVGISLTGPWPPFSFRPDLPAAPPVG